MGSEMLWLSRSRHAKQPSCIHERQTDRQTDLQTDRVMLERRSERGAIPVPDQKGAEEGGTKL